MATNRTRIKQQGPQQTTVLQRDLIVLRKIDTRFKGLSPNERAGILDMLALTQLEPGISEGEMSWFSDGYVANDMPRDVIVTDRIVNSTLGFAIARTDTGEILETFGKDGLARASSKVANAKMMPAIEFDLDEEESDDEPEPEADATEAPAESDES